MCLMSVMTPMEFSRAEYSADHSALFRRNSRNCAIVAVVDTRRVLRARETTARGGGVVCGVHKIRPSVHLLSALESGMVRSLITRAVPVLLYETPRL
jgi:hypothetical protein